MRGTRDVPYGKLRPNTQQAIRNETKRKYEGTVDPALIDAAFDSNWQTRAFGWMGRAGKSFGRNLVGVAQFGKYLVSPVEAEKGRRDPFRKIGLTELFEKEWQAGTNYQPSPILQSIYDHVTQNYGSWDKFTRTMDQDPFTPISDSVSVVVPWLRASKLANLHRAADILDTMDPGNALESITKARSLVNAARPKGGRFAEYDIEINGIDEINEYLGYLERDIKLTPPMLKSAEPGVDRVTGNRVTASMIADWDADDTVYFRITDSDRLHQQYSFVVGEADFLRLIRDENIREVARSYLDQDEAYMELVEQFDNDLEEMERKHLAKRRDILQDRELDEWEKSEELEGLDYYYRMDKENLLTAKREVLAAERWAAIDRLIMEHGYDFEQEAPWWEIENREQQQMGVEEVLTDEGEGLVYPGPNATAEFHEVIEIGDKEGWNWIERQEIQDPVIHVIRGDFLSMTYDIDGYVIRPEETIAVIGWSEALKALQ